MQHNIEHPLLQYVVGSANIVNAMSLLKPMEPFSEPILEFFNDLSKMVLKNAKDYSDVATFGFWCRRQAMLKEKLRYDQETRLGKGTTFHSTPSNVPVNFAFSFAVGFLAGNACIIRLPGKEFEQVSIICDEIRSLLCDRHTALLPYVVMIKYPPIKEITDSFSLIADTRVVWGGDKTIQEIRQSPLKPRASEITFADRYSIAVFDADAYLEADDKIKIAKDFYNDTFYSDQNACTAPRIVVWLGERKEEAKEVFWQLEHSLVKEKYRLPPVQAVEKLSALYRVAIAKKVYQHKTEDNLITRIKVYSLDDDLMSFKSNSGFFFEYDAKHLNDILPICGERCQTLVYYGITEKALSEFIGECQPRGIDRAVPIGKSMDFSLVWDGHDLIREMSREVIVW